MTVQTPCRRRNDLVPSFPALRLCREVPLPQGREHRASRPLFVNGRLYVQTFGAMVHEITGLNQRHPSVVTRRLPFERANSIFAWGGKCLGYSTARGSCAVLDADPVEEVDLPAELADLQKPLWEVHDLGGLLLLVWEEFDVSPPASGLPSVGFRKAHGWSRFALWDGKRLQVLPEREVVHLPAVCRAPDGGVLMVAPYEFQIRHLGGYRRSPRSYQNFGMHEVQDIKTVHGQIWVSGRWGDGRQGVARLTGSNTKAVFYPLPGTVLLGMVWGRNLYVVDSEEARLLEFDTGWS